MQRITPSGLAKRGKGHCAFELEGLLRRTEMIQRQKAEKKHEINSSSIKRRTSASHRRPVCKVVIILFACVLLRGIRKWLIVGVRHYMEAV